jgi:hypothetical protein
VKVVLHPQADAEFLLAQQRYTDASPLLGRRFYDEITSVFVGSSSIRSAISNSTRRRAAYSAGLYQRLRGARQIRVQQ